MYLRHFFFVLLLQLSCQCAKADTHVQTIEYEGISFECHDYCANQNDPKANKLIRIITEGVYKAFVDRWGLPEEGGIWRTLDPYDWNNWVDPSIHRYDRKKSGGFFIFKITDVYSCRTGGFCPPDSDYKEKYSFQLTHQGVKRAFSSFRDDLVFYANQKENYLQQRLATHKQNLIELAKLENDFLVVQYNKYTDRIIGGAESSFGDFLFYGPYERRENYDGTYSRRIRDAKMIEKEELQKIETQLKVPDYENTSQILETAYKNAEILLKEIFLYCLQHHQPEGITFHAAIESFLDGNVSEGIEQLRKLIEIGEKHQFDSDIMSKIHFLKGQLEAENALYGNAIISLTKAIAKNPSLKEAYIDRASTYFALGDYKNSFEDYLTYIKARSQHDLSMTGFSLGVAKGLPKGIYESGIGLIFLLSDFIQSPIHTSQLLWESLTLLAELARSQQLGAMAEIIAPEIYQLVSDWDNLSNEIRGELAGYAFGKHGADLIIPGALAKASLKQIKGATTMSAAYKTLRTADKTLVLETAAGIGDGVKVADVIKTGQNTVLLAEELGLTAREMGQLKQVGELQTATARQLQNLTPSMQESFALHNTAKETLKPYAKKIMPETKVRELIHDTGIPTFPRPTGIPENYLVAISDKGAGMKYINPQNEHIYVRVMPGKLHSPFPYQQKPYVVQMKSGKAIDKQGNLVLSDAAEAHISLDEFIYRQLN